MKQTTWKKVKPMMWEIILRVTIWIWLVNILKGVLIHNEEKEVNIFVWFINYLNNIITQEAGNHNYFVFWVTILTLAFILVYWKQLWSFMFWSFSKAVSSVIIFLFGCFLLKDNIISFYSLIESGIQSFATVSKMNVLYITMIIILSWFIFWILYHCMRWDGNNQVGLLLSDKPIIDFENDKDEAENNSKDKLWFSDKAKSFATMVYNEWDTDGFVFWLVAPWWYGKSSFINLLTKEINSKYREKCKIIKFHPWYFEWDTDLLSKFLQEFSNTLWGNDSELRSKMNMMINLLDDQSKKILWWFFNIGQSQNLEDLRNSISERVRAIDKKIIIVIDDLDRISSQKLKSVFKTVDLCKSFYNTNFILCYNPLQFNNIDENCYQTTEENNEWKVTIRTQEVDNTYLTEYISKIVNIEYSLFPIPAKIKKELTLKYS